MTKQKQETQITQIPPQPPQPTIEILPAKPTEAIKKAKEIAKIVADIVEKRRLYYPIAGKKYVQCEGWTTMGALFGLFPQIVEIREQRIEEKGVKYIAVCEIRTADGKLISRAESECASWEKNKQNQEEFAIRSMAETRAVSKAFRLCLSWVMTLAGYEPLPAEEVDYQKNIEVKVVDIPVPQGEKNEKKEKVDKDRENKKNNLFSE